MAKFIRLLALLFVVAPITAMFSEPFFEAIFDGLGVDTENWAKPLLALFSNFSGLQVLAPIPVALVSLGFGVWVHYFVSIIDRKKPTKSEKLYLISHEITFVNNRIRKMRQLWDDPFATQDNKGVWDASVYGEVLALSNKLRNLGIPFPDLYVVSNKRDWADKNDKLRNALSILYPLADSGHYDEAKNLMDSLTTSFDSEFSD